MGTRIMKRKDEEYRGIILKFFKQDDFIVADSPAHGVMGYGKTKKNAFWSAKETIDYKIERGNLPE